VELTKTVWTKSCERLERKRLFRKYPGDRPASRYKKERIPPATSKTDNEAYGLQARVIPANVQAVYISLEEVTKKY
jgi:hypothetical protein